MAKQTDSLSVQDRPEVKLSTGVVWCKGMAPVRAVIREHDGCYMACYEALMFDTEAGCFVHNGFYGGSYDDTCGQLVGNAQAWLKAQDQLIALRDAMPR